MFTASVVFISFVSLNLVYFTILFVVINYFLGVGLQALFESEYRKRFFWFAIGLNVGILSFFKYINFIFENINYLLNLVPAQPAIPYLDLILPVGISYYTFQAIGYIIRINRGTEKAEKNFGIFATYLIFFPKFLSGPVERSNHFFPQMHAPAKFDNDQVTEGMRLLLWGLFKKVVIANNLVGPVMLIYNDMESYSGVPLIVVMFLQTIHLYCDFSGYTDMALGSAKLFGIDLAPNFNRPFFAKNVGELWRRWHMSLSSWCNDFIFTPFIVKYRKMGNKAAIIGIFLTFFIIGIWHGANWTFVVLGILQGIAISYEFYTKRKRLQIASKMNPKFVTIASRIITFTFFSFSLIFFNSHNIQDSWYFVTHLFSGVELKFLGHDFIFEKANFGIAMLSFLVLLLIDYQKEKGIDLREKIFYKPRIVRWSAYYVVIFLIYYYSGVEETFVYLQF